MPHTKELHSSYKTHVRITDVQRQRNGVSGQPFWAVRFNEESTYDATQYPMLAVVFDEPLYCAVVRLDAPSEHFRGDVYEETMRTVIERTESAHNAGRDGKAQRTVRRLDPIGKTFVF